MIVNNYIRRLWLNVTYEVGNLCLVWSATYAINFSNFYISSQLKFLFDRPLIGLTKANSTLNLLKSFNQVYFRLLENLTLLSPFWLHCIRGIFCKISRLPLKDPDEHAKRFAWYLVGTTDARVACSSIFTRPFSNLRVRNFRLLLITREQFGLASWNFDSSLRLMSCMFVHNFEAIGRVTLLLEPENCPASLA